MIEPLLLAVPTLPLLSALILLLFPLPKQLVTVVALSSVTLAAVAVLIIQLNTATDFAAVHHIFGQWLTIGTFDLNFGFYLDPLSLMMISVISGVGALIHLFSISFMNDDLRYQRYFSYLNLFVAAMLILVLADNLLLLYLGWEGVGLCSYLLIGFWFKERANNRAANKAFIMTRIGDTAMLIGLLIIFWQFGTLDIQRINSDAQSQWLANSNIANLSCLLLFIGAAGKSAQLPLQNWLPDAMAGPTPVSALIHAATMVTAGIYLVSRNIALFQIAADTLYLIAIIGTLTLLLGASAAMVQSDLKRILAYSTVSQLGYMFLALGVGATAAANFHLMTHAFFKALLFLGAGALIHSLDHQHNIFKMGGLRTKLPLIAGVFIIGCAALSSLPLLSGFYSKELILSQVMANNHSWLWAGGVLGAFLTAFYSARLVLVVFWGPLKQQPSTPLPKPMSLVLTLLIILSIAGGVMPEGIARIFPFEQANLSPLAHYLPLLTPFVAMALAYWCYQRGIFGGKLKSPLRQRLHQFLLSGWRFDDLYQAIFVRPFFALTRLNKDDLVDKCYGLLESSMIIIHRVASRTQTGSLRLYNATLLILAIIGLAWLIFGEALV